MISVKKDYNNPPAGLSTMGCQNKIKKALIEKDKHTFSSYYYRGATYEVLKNQIYYSKCGYCETDTTAGAALQIVPKNVFMMTVHIMVITGSLMNGVI